MTAHTPGPWKFTPYGIVPSGIRIDAHAIIARVFSSYAIGSSEGRIEDLPQEANGRLIAEAPLMLDILKRLMTGEGDEVDGALLDAEQLIKRVEGS